MVKSAKRPPGRPRLNPESDQATAYIGFKSEIELREQVAAAAALANHSISLETRDRVKLTFAVQDMFDLAATLAWGGNAPLVFLFGEIVNHIAPKGEWQSDEFAKDSLWLALRHALDVLADPEGAPIEDRGDGADRAQWLLCQLANPNSHWAAAKRQRLGYLVDLIDRRADVLDRALAKRTEPTIDPAVQEGWDRARTQAAARHAEEARKREEDKG
jgi:hypothetical protein